MGRSKFYILLASLVVSSCGGGGAGPAPSSLPVQITLAQMGGDLQGNPIAITGTATVIAGGFTYPYYLATDGKSIFTSDPNIAVKTIWKTDIASGATSQFSSFCAGNNMCNPQGITTDGKTVYAADFGGTVQAIDIVSGKASTLLSGLNQPNAITTDQSNLYIADMGGIKKYDLSTGRLSVLTNTSVRDLTTDGRFLYAINQNAVERVDMQTGASITFAGNVTTPGLQDGTGTNAFFHYPMRISTDCVFH